MTFLRRWSDKVQTYVRDRVVFSVPGLTFPIAFRLIVQHRAQIEAKYFPRVLFILTAGVVVSVLSLFDRLACRRGARSTMARSQASAGPAVFILGYWRSGTTHLHQLLSLDPRFVTPTLFEATAPNCYLTLSSVKGLIKRLLPRTRDYDEMAIDLDAPWEDETALFAMTGLSPYLGSIFPRAHAASDRFIALEPVSPAELDRWKTAFVAFSDKLTARKPGRLLYKSPTHTARIALIRTVFPDAKFIHIARDPYVVFASNMRMLQVFGRQVQLHDASAEDIEAYVLSRYETIYEKYVAQQADLPAGDLAVATYEALVTHPLEELERLYKELNLGGWQTVKPAVERHLETIRNYAPNRYPELAPEKKEIVWRRWGRFFSRWSYS
jgi:omega-hydroxy-beta-dihydromenaquinone-9 sulfotransferase